MKDEELRIRCIECATKLETECYPNKTIGYEDLKNAVKRTIKAADDLFTHVKSGELLK